MEKILHFKTRTAMHIELVQKWAKHIEDIFSDLKGLTLQTEVHDASKYVEPEYTPYLEVNWHYKCKKDGIVYPLNNDAHKATFHHIKSNSHHPEYHDPKATLECLNSSNRDKPSTYMVNATTMPILDIGEMVADWLAVAEERGTDPYEWADMNINIRWKFSNEQRSLIYSIILACWDKKINFN